MVILEKIQDDYSFGMKIEKLLGIVESKIIIYEKQIH